MLRLSVCALAAALELTAAAGAHYPPRPAGPVPYPQGYPPVVRHYPHYPPPAPHCRHYQVLYKTCHAEPWRSYGVYRDDDEARAVARGLRRTGYRAKVDDVR